MAEKLLLIEDHAIPDACKSCKHLGAIDINSRYCPSNVIIGTEGRISAVVDDNDTSFDDTSDAYALKEQLPKLHEAAANCGRLLADRTIDRPSLVTTDLSFTNFTVYTTGYISA